MKTNDFYSHFCIGDVQRAFEILTKLNLSQLKFKKLILHNAKETSLEFIDIVGLIYLKVLNEVAKELISVINVNEILEVKANYMCTFFDIKDKDKEKLLLACKTLKKKSVYLEFLIEEI